MVSWAEPYTPDEGTDAPRQVTPDPKPLKRVRASAEERMLIEEHFEFAACVHCGQRHEHLHHIAFRKADGGDDVIENIAPLCSRDHELFHSRGSGWQRVAGSIRQYVLLNRPRCVYVIGKIGWDRFNSRYPLLSEPGSVGAPSRDSSTGDRLPTAGHDLQPGSENTEKPRRGAWEMDWLPDYREEDVPFG